MLPNTKTLTSWYGKKVGAAGQIVQEKVCLMLLPH